MQAYKGDDEHVNVTDLKASTGMLRRNITLPFYEDIGKPSSAERDALAISLNSYLVSAFCI